MDALLLFGLHASEAGKLQNLSATFCILPIKFQNKIMNTLTDSMSVCMVRKQYQPASCTCLVVVGKVLCKVLF